MTNETLDVAGIGVGPFNLSLAALLKPVQDLRWRFFERRPAFEWQAGMMLPGTRMQTSFLKDLVTPVDPTNPFSFLSYLVDKGRFYRFMNAEFSRVRRSEFAEYMRWAAERIPNLSFGSHVNDVSFDGRYFKLDCERGPSVLARDLVIATGTAPNIPTWAQRHMSGVCLHSGDYMRSDLRLTGQRVLVIGGGQSGAEVFLNVASGAHGQPGQITWVSRRPNLEPLDETTFVNEYFTPDYVAQFHRLPESRRGAIVESQKLAGDGVSPDTLRELSQLLYESDFLSTERGQYRILPYRSVRAMNRSGSGFRVEMQNGFDHVVETVGADVVILATGYQHKLPPCIASISGLLTHDRSGHLKLRKDYVAEWSGPASNRVYVQNGGRYSHGIADPQLSLAAWRAAVIVNSLVGSELYRTEAACSPVQWHSSGGNGLLEDLQLPATRDDLQLT
jgi:lysine N6-hydroxylase